jgi:hypothetical protein
VSLCYFNLSFLLFIHDFYVDRDLDLDLGLARRERGVKRDIDLEIYFLNSFIFKLLVCQCKIFKCS